MDELIPYREPPQPLVKRIEVASIQKVKVTERFYLRNTPMVSTNEKVEVKPCVTPTPTPTPVPVKVSNASTSKKVEVKATNSESEPELDEAAQRAKTQKKMIVMTEIIAQSGGQLHQINAALLDVFEDMPRPLLHYLAGSFCMGGNPGTDGRPPDWMLAAVSVERTKQIFEEYNSGTIGTLATPADVLVALYPPYYLMNCKPVMTEIMYWCMFQVMPKHAPDKMGGLLLMAKPPSYDSIRYEYEELATLVRRKIVESSTLSGKSSKKRRRGRK